ncbi:hypothetical protein D3C81_1157170 [compost metagenome]
MKKITAAELAGQNAHSLIFTFDSKKDENIDIIRTAEEGLGFIAAYVGILLDGDYTMEDIYGICDKIRGRLEEKRTIHLVSEDGSKKEVKGKIIIPSGYKH